MVQIGFYSRFCKSKSIEIWKLGQKGILLYMKLSIRMPTLEILGLKEGCVLYFLTLEGI
jgi:hypothetical protein